MPCIEWTNTWLGRTGRNNNPELHIKHPVLYIIIHNIAKNIESGKVLKKFGNNFKKSSGCKHKRTWMNRWVKEMHSDCRASHKFSPFFLKVIFLVKAIRFSTSNEGSSLKTPLASRLEAIARCKLQWTEEEVNNDIKSRWSESELQLHCSLKS